MNRENGTIFETLAERGFVKQCTDAEALPSQLAKGPLTFYCGFDPTAESLHCGSLVPIMAMAHLQRAGHRPLAIIGGGTTMVGDPSGKTEMRAMLTREVIRQNGVGILAQLRRYLDLDGEKGCFLDNADWLLELRYIDFLRDIGRYFRVNEMLRAESYRARMEREEGLSFIEFNYQLLQAYDFLRLHQDHGCTLQIGGDDQWGNILAGTDLIRRLGGGPAFGLTFPLLTTATGAKMGKTASGAVWLDPQRTSPVDFYQYWRNTDDRDVERFLAYFTFLPMDQVREMGRREGAALNESKECLAFEVTKLCHGESAATLARDTAKEVKGSLSETALPLDRLRQGIGLLDLLVETGLCATKSDARRLVQQGGARLNGAPATDIQATIDEGHLEDGVILLQAGKKKFHKIRPQ
ncbi:MAG: tyrosine--tRNA ligase [Verrucomicrobia bacterium]|nr:tyrosine--tRNA ligase [Verrucomicrobiota bacterium]